MSHCGADRFASPIDAYEYGEYRLAAPTGLTAGRQFTGAISDTEPGRYHLYAGWFCPRSHRALIIRSLLGLGPVVSASFVHGLRDGRGWAFRESTGPDPVNGFTLLRQAYTATDPTYNGIVSVPVLWDRREHRIVNNVANLIDIELATSFGDAGLYPAELRAEIDDSSRRSAQLAQTISRAVYRDLAKAALRSQLAALDRHLAGARYLIGPALTLADIRLWVTLVRYDVGANAYGAAGPRLGQYPNLWSYARELYARPAFRDTTDFDAIKAPLAAVPDWTAARSTSARPTKDVL